MATRSNSTRTNMARLLLPLLAVGLLLPLTGCQKAAEKMAEAALEKATGSKIDLKRDGSSMSIKTDEGEFKVASSVNGESVPLPDDFPKDVFLPEHSTINSAMDMGGMKMVNLITKTPSGDVSTLVQKTMEKRGWKREMAMQDAEGGATLVYSKEKRQIVYTMMKSKEGTQVAVRTGQES